MKEERSVPINVTPKDVERFFAKTVLDLDSGCLLWIGHRDRYGTFSLAGKLVGAHRVAWMIANGPIPDGLCVLHRCDNTACVNIEHLFLGTHRENTHDMITKGRRGSICKGSDNGRSLLTEDDVRAIRAEYVRDSRGNVKEIASRYGVSLATIRAIGNRRRWKHI